jgi:cell division septation protein DedD
MVSDSVLKGSSANGLESKRSPEGVAVGCGDEHDGAAAKGSDAAAAAAGEDTYVLEGGAGGAEAGAEGAPPRCAPAASNVAVATATDAPTCPDPRTSQWIWWHPTGGGGRGREV